MPNNSSTFRALYNARVTHVEGKISAHARECVRIKWNRMLVLCPVSKLKRTAEQLGKEDVPVVQVENTQLTSLELTEDVVVDVDKNSRVIVDPYPNKTPNNIVEREYLIASYAMTDGMTQLLSPAKLLYENQTIQDYLKLFTMVRANVKIRIVIVSTQMQYGGILVSKIPFTAANSTKMQNIHQQVQSDCYFLDICEQQAMEMELPYMKPKTYDMIEDTTTATFQDWRVCLNCIELGTITTGTPTSVSVRIFGSFTNLEAAGYKENVAQFQAGRGDSWRDRINQAEAAFRFGTTAYAFMEKAFSGNPDTIQDAKTLLGVETNGDEQVKMDLGSALSAPITGSRVTGSVLGDARMGVHSALPDLRNIYRIRDVVQTPTYVGQYSLSSSGNGFTLSCIPPALTYSHLAYLLRCFRYYRGGVSFYFRIMCSPLISGRLKAVLYPATKPGDSVSYASSTIGDLPSWILSIKGPTEWAISVPYLQPTPWTIPTLEVFEPKLAISLLDDIVQPFDKTVGISIVVFAAAAPDFEMAGLQSNVPMKVPTERVAQFQCSIGGAISGARLLGGSNNYQYIGGIQSIEDVISRFSTRTEKLAYPYPIHLANWTEVYNSDLFDWIASLYAFYTGPINVKVMFAKAPASGLLEMSLASRLTKANGLNDKSGNSYTMTHQAVWPMLEYVYPYLSNVEFDSLIAPQGDMFAEVFSDEAQISKYLTSAAEGFKLFYLMPLPDFFFTTEEVQQKQKARKSKEKVAIFQSGAIPRRANVTRIAGAFTFGSSSGGALQIATLPSNESFEMKLDVSVTKNSGTAGVGCAMVISLDSAATTSAIQGGLNPSTLTAPLAVVVHPYDTPVHNSDTQVVMGAIPALYVTARTLYASSTTPTWNVHFVVTIRPFSALNCLSSYYWLNDTLGHMSVDNTVTVSNPTTQNVAVVNTPSVSISGTPSVTVSNSPTVVVTPNPLPVTIDPSSAAIAARIQGVLDPDTPVWCSQYFTG